MAHITIANNVNMLDSILQVMDIDDDYLRPITTTTTQFVVQTTTGYTAIFDGNNLRYERDGEPESGTFTSLDISHNGQSLFSISGLSVPVDIDVYDNGYDGQALGGTSEIAYWLRAADTVTGGTGSEVLYGFGGNDQLTGGAGNDRIDGGNGTDTAIFSGSRASYEVQTANATTTTISGTDGSDTLISIERLQFDDMTLALDINGNAGQAYRLYQAAFNRTPDNDGLKYWIAQMDSGATLTDVAKNFTATDEFMSLYGSSNPSNDTLVQKMYENVMHRAPDADGYNYWMNMLATGQVDTVSLLQNFSESAENQANVIGTIQDGIELFA